METACIVGCARTLPRVCYCANIPAVVYIVPEQYQLPGLCKFTGKRSAKWQDTSCDLNWARHGKALHWTRTVAVVYTVSDVGSCVVTARNVYSAPKQRQGQTCTAPEQRQGNDIVLRSRSDPPCRHNIARTNTGPGW
jgi:hypothetical protein